MELCVIISCTFHIPVFYTDMFEIGYDWRREIILNNSKEISISVINSDMRQFKWRHAVNVSLLTTSCISLCNYPKLYEIMLAITPNTIEFLLSLWAQNTHVIFYCTWHLTCCCNQLFLNSFKKTSSYIERIVVI